MKHVGCVALLLLSLSAFAARANGAEVTAADDSLQSVYTMQVNGLVTIDPQGHVVDYQRTTDVEEKLQVSLDRAVRSWLFVPVLIDGTPAQVKARMQITLAAEKDGDNYMVSVDDVTFSSLPGDKAAEASDEIPQPTPKKHPLPRPPQDVARLAMAHTLTLRMQIGFQVDRQGKVANVVVVQTAIPDVRADSRLLATTMQEYAKATETASKGWRFDVDSRLFSPETRTYSFTCGFETRIGIGDAPRHPDEDKEGKWRFVTRTALREMPWLNGDPNVQRVGVCDTNPGEVVPIANTIRLASAPIGKGL